MVGQEEMVLQQSHCGSREQQRLLGTALALLRHKSEVRQMLNQPEQTLGFPQVPCLLRDSALCINLVDQRSADGRVRYHLWTQEKACLPWDTIFSIFA